MYVSGWWYFWAFVLPFVGVILGIIAMAHSQVGPGIALWATSICGWFTAIMFILGAG